MHFLDFFMFNTICPRIINLLFILQVYIKMTLAPASMLFFTRMYAAAVRSALTISNNSNKDIIMNISENATSVRPEVKDVATVLQQVKTTIRQRYLHTVVNLKSERKWVKTRITAYGTAWDNCHVGQLITMIKQSACGQAINGEVT